MLQVHSVAAFNDNYIWVISEGEDKAAIVDPGDAAPVLSYLQGKGWQASAILITHKHYDHIGGIAQLKTEYPDAPVYGPAGEQISGLDYRLRDGDRVTIPGMKLSLSVLEVPGHTEGHIAYLTAGKLFCGDTLFACGCGRVFSGTMSQLYQSLNKISSLPEDTLVYCAHEYTLDNIGFAKWVEPENAALLQREQAEIATRKQKRPTIPTLLQKELATNPFLRAYKQDVVRAAERYAERSLDNPEAVFSVLRQWKDEEYD